MKNVAASRRQYALGPRIPDHADSPRATAGSAIAPRSAHCRSAHPKLDDELNKLAWGATIPRLSADPAATDPDRYRAFADFMKGHGLIDHAEPLERYIGR